jgi:hypothetical protein
VRAGIYRAASRHLPGRFQASSRHLPCITRQLLHLHLVACVPALHHTPYDGHRMAYAVCCMDRMGLTRWGNPLEIIVCHMAYGSYDASLVCAKQPGR